MKELKKLKFSLHNDLLNECIIFSTDNYLIIGSILKFIPKNNYLNEYKNSWIEWCCNSGVNNNREFYENKWELLTNDNDKIIRINIKK
jgi:CTP:phosphocholine cytidylyltransferase-like protein